MRNSNANVRKKSVWNKNEKRPRRRNTGRKKNNWTPLLNASLKGRRKSNSVIENVMRNGNDK